MLAALEYDILQLCQMLLVNAARCHVVLLAEHCGGAATAVARHDAMKTTVISDSLAAAPFPADREGSRVVLCHGQVPDEW